MTKRTIIVFFCTCIATIYCEPPPSNQYGTPLGAPISSYGTPNYNANDDHHGDYGEPKAYEFGYQVKDDYTGNNYDRKEQSDGNQVRGEYRVQLPDGRTQIVTYYADWQTGFHADVKYEGTAQYPDQYNNGGGYNNGPSNQYGAPSGGDYGGYNNGAGTSSVSIKDYSGEGNSGGHSGGFSGSSGGYQGGSAGSYSGSGGYSNNYNNGYDSYSNGGYSNRRPGAAYGAP